MSPLLLVALALVTSASTGLTEDELTRVLAGEAPIRVETFTFRGPRFSLLEDRSVHLLVLGAPMSILQRARRRAPLWGGLVALVLAAGLWWKRRRRA